MKALCLLLALIAGNAWGACTGNTDIYCPIDNSVTSTCGDDLTWSGSASYTTSNAPSPNTYWATATGGTYLIASSTGVMSATEGYIQYVFRTGSDITTTQFVSCAKATGTGSSRWLDIYITAGGINFYNLTPGLAGSLGALATNTTYYIQANWSASGVRIYKGTAKNSLSQVYTSGSTVLSTSPTIAGSRLGSSQDLGLPITSGNYAQYRQGTVAQSGTWVEEGADTPTPTPNWTATPTPTISPTQVPCATGLRIQQFGDSFQLGTACDATEAGIVGLRDTLINDLSFTYGRPGEFISSTGNYGGRLQCNYTQAVSAQTTTVMLANMPAQLASMTSPYSYNDIVLIGGGTAGQILGENATLISDNWNDMMDLVYAKSDKILIVLINPAWNPTQDVSVTTAAWNTSMAYGIAQKYRILGYNSYGTLGVDSANVCPSPDGLHPTHAAQIAMGHALAAAIHGFLGGTSFLSPYVKSRGNFMTPLLWQR